MARAEQFVPPPIKPPTEIRLTLSQDEARILHLLTGHVNGRESGWRGVTREIYLALNKVVGNPLLQRDVFADDNKISLKDTKE